MDPLISIIIPTFNNPEYLTPCVTSIGSTGALNGLAELIIVNNGKQPIKELVAKMPNTVVLEPGENLGWERGLAYGLGVAKGRFLCFQNDDTLIPKANQNFYSQMLYPFADGTIAAVGPATTVAAGWHSIFLSKPLRQKTEVTYLIFFTVMIRRSDFEAAGGLDTTCPGGDDIDLSIRLRKLGKHLVVNPEAFLIHHGFKTGERVRGAPTVAGGWNSKEMQDTTKQWLIQKHGFKVFLETTRGFEYLPSPAPPDTEGDLVRSLVRGPKIAELGCGFTKTVPQAIGIDWAGPGAQCSYLENKPCVADIQADVSKALPLADLSIDTLIARHILEHLVDTVEVLHHWNRSLKLGGRLVIAVPNQETCSSIPLNPEHVHAFTPKSLKSLLEFCGFKELEWHDPKNGVSFVGCYEKVLHLDPSQNGKTLEAVNV